MSVSVTTDVFCDFCNNWEHGVTGNRAKARAARIEVGFKGWTRTWDNGSHQFKDVCPECRKELEL